MNPDKAKNMYALEMEQAVIGAVLLERSAFARVQGVLREEMFAHKAHPYIFSAIMSLAAERKPIDLLTVVDRLRSRGVLDDIGGPFYLTELVNKVASSANLEYHAMIVAQKHIARKTDRLAEGARLAIAAGGDPIRIMSDLKRELDSITPVRSSKPSPVSEVWSEEVKAIEANAERLKSGIVLAGAPSGFHELDKITLGFDPGNVYLFAGDTGMGKTALIIKIAISCAMAGHPVFIRSLEMSKESFAMRMAAYGSSVSTWRMRKGDVSISDFSEMNAAMGDWTNMVEVEDKGGRDSDSIYAQCKDFSDRWAGIGKFPIFMLDYIQLVKSSSARGTREQEVSEVSKMWKAVTMDLGGPSIALSQLSRSVTSRADKKPILSDLRESGSLEQDASFVGLLYRPDHYGIETYSDGSSTKGNGMVIIAKYREGVTGEVMLGWNKHQGWVNPEDVGRGQKPSDDGLGVDPRRVQPKAIDFGESRHNQEYEGSDRGARDNFPF